MFRKLTFALAAATVVATAAIPTAASADWRDGWRRNHHRSGVVVRFSSPHYAYAPRCYVTKRWVHTRWGWQKQRIRHCR
jgi:hypothetical protein